MSVPTEDVESIFIDRKLALNWENNDSQFPSWLYPEFTGHLPHHYGNVQLVCLQKLAAVDTSFFDMKNKVIAEFGKSCRAVIRILDFIAICPLVGFLRISLNLCDSAGLPTCW